MFKNLMDLSRQRDVKGAVAFYFVALLIGAVFSFFLGLSASIFLMGGMKDTGAVLEVMKQVGLVVGIFWSFGLAAGILVKKHLRHPLDYLLILCTPAFGIFGAIFGLLPVAVLSFRPKGEPRG